MNGSTIPGFGLNNTYSKGIPFGSSLYAKYGYAFIQNGAFVLDRNSKNCVMIPVISGLKLPADGGYDSSSTARELGVESLMKLSPS